MKRLQRWLDDNRVTQREFADRCSLTPGAISQYINGITDPSLDSLKVIARETGLTTDELLFGDPDSNRKGAVRASRGSQTVPSS